jgi:hypothetical protein
LLKEPKISKSALKAHSKYVASLQVCVAGFTHNIECTPVIQSCHVRKGFYCMSRKPAKRELPMCDAHHLRQHSIGEDKFWDDRMEDAFLLCQELWDVTGDWEQGHMLCNNFIRDR